MRTVGQVALLLVTSSAATLAFGILTLYYQFMVESFRADALAGAVKLLVSLFFTGFAMFVWSELAAERPSDPYVTNPMPRGLKPPSPPSPPPPPKR